MTAASIADSADISQAWQLAQQSGHASFFNSWPWISTWLDMLRSESRVKLLLYTNDFAAGHAQKNFGLIGIGRTRTKLGFQARSAALHETSIAELDVLAVEQNGLVGAPKGDPAPLMQLVAELFLFEPKIDQLCLSSVARSLEEPLERHAKSLGLCCEIVRRSPSYYVDLSVVRSPDNPDYLEQLGRNTRYRVRRAMRELADLGELHVQRAENVQSALSFFDQLKQLHQINWKRKGQGGAFERPFFEEFHRRLISNNFEQGYIELLRFSAGSRHFGYLYLFRHQSEILSYQSGFDLRNPDLNPGLVSHVMAVNYYAKQGLNRYDFLEGDTQYKRNFSNASYELSWMRIYRPRLIFKLEDCARSVWRTLRKLGEIDKPESESQ